MEVTSPLSNIVVTEDEE